MNRTTTTLLAPRTAHTVNVCRQFVRLMCLAAPLLACDGGADAGDIAAIQVDTLNGIIHMTHRGTANAAPAPWRADTAHPTGIGELDGPAEYVFGRLAGVMVAEDGRIIVGDALAGEIRIYSSAGEFLARFGRTGEGPGEFRSIGGLGRGPAGSISVLDPQGQAVHRFGADGTWQGSLKLNHKQIVLGTGMQVHFDRNGEFHDLTRSFRFAMTPGWEVDSLTVVRYDPEGVAGEPILAAVDSSQVINIVRERELVATLSVPFIPRSRVAIGPDGTIFSTTGATYEIVERAQDGDTLRVVRLDLEPEPVGTAERDSILDAFIELHTERAGVAPRETPVIPDRRPAIEALVTDELGYLWALRGNSDSAVMTWDILAPDGAYLGPMTLPRMTVSHIGESSIAGIVRDELDVQRVRVIPLAR